MQKQKAVVVGKGGEVKSRTALNNISNNVENVNRPITRLIFVVKILLLI